MEHLNILLTSVGRRSYLVEYFKKALNGRGLVHAANSSDVSPAFLVADRNVVTPLIYDSSYISFLIDYCKKNEIKAIISLFDIDLLVLSHNKKEFEDNGIKVIVADEDVIRICNDKWNTYQFLTRNGICAPKTYLSLDEALEAVKEGIIDYPLVVKPRWGMGSIGVYSADNEAELKCFFKKITNVISNSYLKYESSRTPDQAVLVQEKLKGQEYGLDIMNDLNGSYVNTSAKIKFAMRSGETDSAVTVDDPRMSQLGEKLGKLLKHEGNLDADVFEADGKVYVLELNARFGGGYPFSHAAGVDMPQAIVNWLAGEECDSSLFVPKPGIMSQKDISIVYLKHLEGIDVDDV